MTALRIAMIGLRGLPPTWGGIERHVEQIGTRLIASGHQVDAFCRPHYTTATEPEYAGIGLRAVPCPNVRGFEAFIHSGLSSLATLGRKYDIVHFHAIGPGLFMPLPRYLSTARVVQTIHGMDNKRAKWGRGARAVLNSALWVSGRTADQTITVSETLARNFAQELGRESVYIPNGCPSVEHRAPDLIRSRYGLEGEDYLLYVGRLVPEKAPHQLIQAFRSVDTSQRLVIVGGSSHTDDYEDYIRKLAAEDDRVIVTGYQYGDILAELFSNASLYVQPSLLEGLPLTVLEAVAYDRPIIASDIGPHVEVLGDSGPGRHLVSRGDEEGLTEAMQLMLEDPEKMRLGGRQLAAEVRPRYDWDDIAARTEAVYLAAQAA